MSEGGSFFEEREAGDSFLEKMLEVDSAPRLPVSGERFGGSDGRRYTVLGWMGSGGMGQVFRARDEVLGRAVALKFLLPDEGFEEAGLREARAVARLDHENIVRIFDVAEWRGAPGAPLLTVLVMECLEGESLAALLKRGLPDLCRALELLEGITAGLMHAHERQLLHRDLKPGNVFITRPGTVKLLDFGLSHFSPSGLGHPPEPPTSGTPAYMAPEQCRGEPQDARTDVWGVGVMLHELLTGRLPHPGTTPEELRAWVTSPEPVPPVRARRPEVPHEVEVLLASLLAKDPARRFRSALELRAELHEVRDRLRGEASQPLVTQRAQVTLVSCLLTGLAEREVPLDEEDVVELETAFHEACAEVIERHGGSVALSVGGEVLACFGCPQGREEDAERAVHAGLQLARWPWDTVQRQLPHLSLSGLSVRTGIHTDLIAVGGRALQGEAPKVAAWLAQQASPGRVVIGDTSWKLVRGAFDTEPLGFHAFERLSGPVGLNVHRVLGKREVASRFDRTLGAGRLSPLVGREREREQLLALWEGARHERGAFVLLSGEAGIGKSRLIQELCEQVAREPALLLRVQCWFRSSTRAPHPAAELLQEVVHFSPEDPPPQRLRKLEERLGEMGLSEEDAHLMGQFLSLPIPEDAPVHQLMPEQRKRRTFEAVMHILLHKARYETPVLLVVEDLHWASSTQLEFLGFLLERVRRERMLVVLSTRPELRPDWPLRDWFHVLDVERLPAGLARTLVEEVAHDHELPAETVQRLVHRTDGIPLFIEEMTRMVLEGGPEASIPVTLHELLLARLDLLPSRQKALAQLCAVVGRDFSRALLAALLEREDTTLERELAGLVEAGLLQEEEGAEAPGYRFRHALIQEAAWQSLSRGTRRKHHRHIARVLEERFPQVGEEKPEVLAHHYTEAGEVEPALRHWLRAGQLANQRWALQEAVSHLTLALKLLPGLPDARQRLRMELRVSSALSIPLAYLHGYGSPAMERLSQRCRELFLQPGEEVPLNELSSWGMLAYAFARGENAWILPLGGRFLEEGERRNDPEVLSVGHRLLATPLFLQGRLREARAHIEQAVACARLDVEAPPGRIAPHWTDPKTTALALAGIIYSVEGHPGRARSCGQRALELAEHIGQVHTTAYALTYTAIASHFRHEPEDALRLADQSLALQGERGYWFWFWHLWAVMVRGWALSELGRGREALGPMRRELESCRAQGIRAELSHCFGLLASVHLRLGETGEGLEALREALTEMRSTGERFFEPELFRLHGELLRAQGKRRKARTRFLHAIDLAANRGAGLFELRATVGLGRLLWELGQPQEARRLLARACARFDASTGMTDLQEARALLDALQRFPVEPRTLQ
ncbi:protein kinase domain-containing protein [Archangium lansingense]|uniref:Protein kinase n=1 Tax=Archangium lansingense TaxID=2995310 RepID=A0ABT3ZVB0_9BACT|nr:protein kinase [Archangium lansinium]MCY1073347.1 protein kinase [Archangium lansinium]